MAKEASIEGYGRRKKEKTHKKEKRKKKVPPRRTAPSVVLLLQLNLLRTQNLATVYCTRANRDVPKSGKAMEM